MAPKPKINYRINENKFDYEQIQKAENEQKQKAKNS